MLKHYEFLWTVSRTGDQSSAYHHRSADHHFMNHCVTQIEHKCFRKAQSTNNPINKQPRCI